MLILLRIGDLQKVSIKKYFFAKLQQILPIDEKLISTFSLKKISSKYFQIILSESFALLQ